MLNPLKDLTIAVIVTDGFEPSEFHQPVEALRSAGATVEVISLHAGPIRGKNEEGPGVAVDRLIDHARSADYEGLVIPGGSRNAAALRDDDRVLRFVREIHDQQKPIGAVCHGPWVLAAADLVAGRDMTSYPGIQEDLRAAGANWIDAAVVTDEGVVSSRTPEDLQAFCDKLVEELAEGPHERRGRPGRPLLRRPLRVDSDYVAPNPVADDDRSHE